MATTKGQRMTSSDMVIDDRGVILNLGKREGEFQDWWKKWSEITGLSRDPNPDLHFYDNRKAFLAGIEPKIDPADGKYHWDSAFKYRKEVEGVDHPNRYVDGQDTTAMKDYKPYTGSPVSFSKDATQEPTQDPASKKAPLTEFDAFLQERGILNFGRPKEGSAPGEMESVSLGGELDSQFIKYFDERNKYKPDSSMSPMDQLFPPQDIVDNSKSREEFIERSKSFLKQTEDLAKWSIKNPATAINASVDDWLQKFFKGASLGAIDLDSIAAWVGEKTGIPVRSKSVREGWVKEDIGYLPTKPIEFAGQLAESAGAMATYGAVLGGFAPLTEGIAVPALKIVARSLVNGTIAGMLQTPGEGVDGILARLKQIPSNVLFFTVMETGLLTAGKIAQILKWEDEFGALYSKTGGRRPVGKQYTTEEIQKVFNKQNLAGTPGDMGPLTAEETAIVDRLKQSPNGWSRAIKEGWIETLPAEKFPRRPRASDIIEPEFKVATDLVPISVQKGTQWDTRVSTKPYYEPPWESTKVPPQYRPGHVPPIQEPPIPGLMRPSAGELLPASTETSVPVPEPPTVPGEPLALPRGVQPIGGNRLPENAEQRRIIDIAINDHLGKVKATAEELDLARGMLEHESMVSIGNAKLLDIQERNNRFKYYAVVDLEDMRGWNNLLTHEGTDNKVLTQIQDVLQPLNQTDNPMDWKASRWHGDEFVLGGDDPTQLQNDVKKIQNDLAAIEIPGANGKKIELKVGYGASRDEADKNFYLTKNAPKNVETVTPTPIVPVPEVSKEPIYHWTQPENIEKIYDKGFNSKLPPNFGVVSTEKPRGVKGFATDQKVGRGVLYFTRDPARYSKTDIYVGAGNGDKDYDFYNVEKKKWDRIPMALKETPLKSIEATLKPGIRILVLDSVDKYIKFKGDALLNESIPKVVKAARKADYDVLEIKHVPGQWERPGYTDKKGNKDLYAFTTGGSGKDDFFVFNKKAINVPAAGTYKARKLFEGKAAASRKRGLVGWPKGKIKIWDDIFEITNGTGIKPEISTTNGKMREEFRVNVPQFMWNNRSRHEIDTVSDELESKYGYKFDNEDIYSLLKSGGMQEFFGKGSRLTEEGEDIVPMSEDDLSQLVAQRLQPLFKEGEDIDAYFERAKKEAVETGFGDDYLGYIDAQMDLVEKAKQEKIDAQFNLGKTTPQEEAFNLTRTGELDKTIVEQQIESSSQPENGPDYQVKLPGHKRKGGYKVDKIEAWFNEGKLKYPYTSFIGDISGRELLQNFLDAMMEALENGEITEGIWSIKYGDKYIYATDNGIGMSDDDIVDKFLSLHSSGKRKMGRFGGMGIAKAVILAPDPTSTWTLHTRDNWYTHDMANSEAEVAPRKKIQGTRIFVKADNKITSSDFPLFILTTKFPINIRGTLEKGSGMMDKAPGKKREFLLGHDLFKGLSSEFSSQMVNNNLVETNYYPIPEIQKAGIKDLLNKKIIVRIADAQTGARLTQYIETEYGDFQGTLVVDITSDFPPGNVNYPFTDSRMNLKWELNQPIRKITERFAVDKASAMRAGLKKELPIKLSDVSPRWRSVIKSMPSNPSFIRFDKVAREIYRESHSYNGSIAPYDPYLPLDKYNAEIDEGFTGDYSETPYNALCAMAYDVALRYACGIEGINYKGPKFIYSKEIGGYVAGSSWKMGVVGYNPATFGDKTATKSPKHLADALFDISTHEMGHDRFQNHGQDFEIYVDSIRSTMIDHKSVFLDLAEAIHGKLEVDRFKVRSWAADLVPFRLPTGITVKVRKKTLDMLGQKQLEFIKQTEETNEPRSAYDPDTESHKLIRSSNQPGLFEGDRNRQRPRLVRPTVDIIPGSRPELANPPSNVSVDKEGVGVREGFGLTNPEPPPPPFKPEAPYVPREGERVPQGVLGMPDASPLFQGTEVGKPKSKKVLPPKTMAEMKEIQDAVYKFTSRPYSARNWAGNTQEQIEDNRNNMIVYTISHYDPAAGESLENYINSIKKWFHSGEMPSGSATSEAASKGVKVPMPEARAETIETRGTVSPQFPTTANLLGGPESVPKNKFEYPVDIDAVEIELEKEVENVSAILRDVARRAIAEKVAGAGSRGLFGEQPPADLENTYVEILAGRLLDNPETYRSLAARLNISKSLAQEIFEDLLPRLKDSPQIVEMFNRRWRDLDKKYNPESGSLTVNGKSIADFLNKWLAPTKGVSKYVDKQNDLRIGARIAEIYDQTLDGKTLKKWLDKQPFSYRSAVYDVYTGAISGNGPTDIQNTTQFPQEIKDILLRIRKRSDLLTLAAILFNAPPDATKITMYNNLGKYIEARYRIYETIPRLFNPRGRWEPNAAQRAGFKRILMNPPTNHWHPPMTSDEAEVFMDHELATARSVRRKGGLGASGLTIPQDSYLHKRDLSPEWKEFAGEIGPDDVTWLLLDTVMRQAITVANSQFLTMIANHHGEYTPQNMGGIWTKNPDTARILHRKFRGTTYAESWQDNKLEDNQKYGPLRDAYVAPEIYDYIKKQVYPSQHEVEKWLQRLVMKPYKWVRTIGNVPSGHMRNLIGNGPMSFLARNSVYNPLNFKYYADAIDLHLKMSTSRAKEWSDDIRAGVTDTGLYGRDIEKLTHGGLNIDNPRWLEELYDKAFKLPVDKLSEYWNFEDSLFRVAAHLHNMDRGMSVAESVDDINISLTNYGKNPKVVNSLQKVPIFGAFVSFKANILKNAILQGERAWKDMNDPDPKKKKEGWARAFRLGLYLAAPSIASQVFKAIFQVDDKDTKELEKYMQPWQRNGTFIYFRVDKNGMPTFSKDGKLKAVDFSYLYPTGDFERVIKGMFSGDFASAKEALNFLSVPVLDLIQMGIYGKDPKFGQAYNSAWDRMVAIGKYLFVPAGSPLPSIPAFMKSFQSGESLDPGLKVTKDPVTGEVINLERVPGGGNLMPGTFTGQSFKAIYDAWNNVPSRYGEIRNLPESIKNYITGIRSFDVDPLVILGKALSERKFEYNKNRSEIVSWLSKNVAAPGWSISDKIKELNERNTKLTEEVMAITTLLEKLSKDAFKLQKDSGY